MSKNIGTNISKNFSVKCGEKVLDHAKQSATDALKTSLMHLKERFKKQQKQLVI